MERISFEDLTYWDKQTKALLADRDSEDLEKRVFKLRGVLLFHEYRYYVLDAPLISDFEYDTLYKELQRVELAHPEWVTPDSPTQRVASDISEDFPAVPHLTPMLSLENSYDEVDLLDFDRQVKKWTSIAALEPIAYCVEPKFDGGTIVLVYEGDQLVRGATRGDGNMGEEITANVRAIKSIPITVPFSKLGWFKVELRGEALIRKDVFNRINATREQSGLPLFANPRNAATGGLRVKEVKDIQSRGMEIFVYQISAAYNEQGEDVLHQIGAHYASLELLQQLGFKVPFQQASLVDGIDKVLPICVKWESEREIYPYEIDGMVIKVNDYLLQQSCGSTSHHPRWAVAFKFKAKQATSTLLSVEYQVGKTGAITPVAKIAPVALAGVTISSVSLHNADFILDRDIWLGDQILVERAGDVIPYIVKSFPELRNGSEEKIHFPTDCPSCGEALVRPADEAVWRCENDSCPAQSLQRIIHHVSKDGMDIEGFGKSLVERLYQLGWINNIADIYYLDYDRLSSLDGFGVKSAENIKKAIDKAKNAGLHMLLQSLSIRQLGKRAARLIASEIKDIRDLYEWDEERYTSIKEIGPILAANMQSFFGKEANRRLLERMEAAGVSMISIEQTTAVSEVPDGLLRGKKILFTGTLTQMGRQEAQSMAERAGATNISAVSSQLQILVCGENAGSKLRKAEALGTVTILSEEEFLKELERIGLLSAR
jgi:DNA ligase (NAD+)